MWSSTKSAVPPTGAHAALRLASGKIAPARVRRVADNVLTVEARLPTMPSTGASLEICWSESKNWFALPVIVQEADAERSTLRLEIDGRQRKASNRREETRHNLQLVVKAVVERGSAVAAGHLIRSQTVDVSVGGVSFDTELNLKRGDRVRLSLLNDGGQLGTDTQAVVCWTAPRPGLLGVRVGVEFHQPSEALRRAVRLAIARHC